MEHTDFYMMYKAIRDKEVVETGYAFLEFGSIDSLLDEFARDYRVIRKKERSRRYGCVLYPTSFFLF